MEEPAAEAPRREWAAAEEPPPEAPPRAPRPEEELYAALGARLRTPPVVSAGIIGAGALGVCFAVALVLAALPDRSLIGFLGDDATYLEETFRQMCQLVLAGFQNDALFDIFRQTDRVAPLIFALVPITATFLLARNQRPRLHTLPFWPRLAWAAAGGLVFALLMLVPALLTGNVDADAGQVFGYSLLWGVLGSVSGTFAVSPEGREQAGTVHSRLPETGRTLLGRDVDGPQAARPRPARHLHHRDRAVARAGGDGRADARRALAAHRAHRLGALRGRPRRPHVPARHAGGVRQQRRAAARRPQPAAARAGPRGDPAPGGIELTRSSATARERGRWCSC